MSRLPSSPRVVAAAPEVRPGEVSEVRACPASSSGHGRGTVGHAQERSVRLLAKVGEAEALLEQLPPTDTRAALLRVAVLRRDEVLIDGLLAELSRHAPAPPPRRRLQSGHRLKR